MFDKYGRGLISWTELGAIMKALGFPEITPGLLSRAKIENNPSNSAGLDNKELQKLLHSEQIHITLDYTFNKHNSTYNVRVIKKVIAILISGGLSIEEIREARMSFMLHEGELSVGIPLEEKALLNALRVTGKMIAPKKLQEWIKHFTPDVAGKLQLYEYFDLIKICEDKEQLKKQVLSRPATAKTKSGLYELANDSFLYTPDQKILKKMDEEYENMLNLFQAQQVLPAEKAKEIKHQKKEKSIRSGSKLQTQLLDNYTAIRQQISESNEQLRRAKALRKTSNTEYDVFQNRFKNRTVSSSAGPKHSDSGYILKQSHLSEASRHSETDEHRTPNSEAESLFADKQRLSRTRSERRSWSNIERWTKDASFTLSESKSLQNTSLDSMDSAVYTPPKRLFKSATPLRSDSSSSY